MCDHHQLRAPTPAGEIQHVNYMSENIGALFMRPEYSDVTLVIENTKFPAHKVILAARSEYFRALLYGGMRESSADEIELKETNAQAFHYLLKYIYTGKMYLADLREEILLSVMGLAHQYVFKDLEVAISDYLKANLNSDNVCVIYDISCMYELKSLSQKCCEFMDRNATEIINSDAFLSLSSVALQGLIARDSFCAREIEIFKAVQRWKEPNLESDVTGIIAAIRLPLMTIDELLNDVRASSLVCPDAILDAIKVKNESRSNELKYRGFLCTDENVATMRQGAKVIRGEMKSSLLDGDSVNYDLDRGFTRHPIEDSDERGVVIQLGAPHIINCVRMLLWDRDMRSYSYHIDVSMDDKDWITVVDHSKYLCRSWQYLRFHARVVKYIRIVGTHNTVNRVFHVVSFECMYTKKPCNLHNGIIVPSNNVATTSDSACVIEGVSRSRNALINGDTKNYDWDSGYTCHQLGSGAIVVQLAQPYVIDSLRLLLWDCDGRTYSYYIEVSTDQHNWSLVGDKTREACRSWQTIVFDERQPVTFIRIVGTHNTANEVFHCVHFECPADGSALEELERSRGLEAVNLSLNAPPLTAHAHTTQRHDEDADVSSDPEDDMVAARLRAHPANDLPEAHVPAVPYHGAAALGHDAAQHSVAYPYLAAPAPLAAAAAQMAVLPYGAVGGNLAANMADSDAARLPARLERLDRGDGFGVEAAPDTARDHPSDRANSPAHSD